MEYKVFELANKNGMKVKVTEFGANVMEIWAPDRDGKAQDVVMGLARSSSGSSAASSVPVSGVWQTVSMMLSLRLTAGSISCR